MCKPDWPINDNRPTVFRETVLPPVLGPVTISRLKSFPKLTSIGTTSFGSSNGWRPCLIFIKRLSLNSGMVAFIFLARFAFAKIKSSLGSNFMSVLSCSIYSLHVTLKLARIIWISSASLTDSSRNLLLSSTTTVGSTKRVEPVEDWSWIIPGTLPRYSCLTGTQ